MAFTPTTLSEIQSGGSDSNAGSFDPGSAGFATDLVASLGTSGAPTVSSASYTFIGRDVGAWLFVQAGVNWYQGWYKITAVNAGAATINAAIGSAASYNGATSLSGIARPTTLLGCGSAASLTGGTWGIDYSQQSSPAISYTDMVIDAATNTNFTSAANPVGKHLVGNLINITAGTGFSVQRVQIASVSGTVATCDKSLGTQSSTGGTGVMGGALLTLGFACSISVAKSSIYRKSLSESITSTSNNVANGKATPPGGTGGTTRVIGYELVRGDNSVTRPISICGINAATVMAPGVANYVEGHVLDGNGANFTGTVAFNTPANGAIIVRCKFQNFSGVSAISTSNLGTEYANCEFFNNLGTNCIASVGKVATTVFHDNTAAPLSITAAGPDVAKCVFVNNGGVSIAFTSIANSGRIRDCLIYNAASHGINIAPVGALAVVIENCLIAKCGGFGVTGTAGCNILLLNCAFWSNTSGNVDPALLPNAINCVTLTADPFVKASIPVANLAIDASNNKKVTSGTYTFVAGDVGATLYVTNQTGGWTAGQYTVASVVSGAAILTASPGTVGSTSGNWYFNNFNLNNTPGGGAAAQSVGVPAVSGVWGFQGVNLANYDDIGAGTHGGPVLGSRALLGVGR